MPAVARIVFEHIPNNTIIVVIKIYYFTIAISKWLIGCTNSCLNIFIRRNLFKICSNIYAS